MDKHKCKSTVKQLFSEAMPYRISEVHQRASIAALTYISIVVLTYCRMEIRIHFNTETKRQISNERLMRVYKSIIIYLLKDSNQ
jgi:hypothetical protein